MAFVTKSLGLLVPLWFKKKKRPISCEVVVLSIRDNIRERIVNCDIFVKSDTFVTGSQRRERSESMEWTAETYGRVLED